MSYLKNKRQKTTFNIEENNGDKNIIDFNYDSNLGDWIIDTDPGVDDSIAISLAMNMIKEHLVLLSIQFGNNTVETCLKNAKRICVINKRKYNISKGESLTISTYKPKGFSVVHGEDGFYDLKQYTDLELQYDNEKTEYLNNNEKTVLKRHSAIEIISLSKEYEKANKKLNLLTIGPLTNIALAYMIDPKIVNRINRFVIMGGSYNSNGNTKPSGEMNFDSDNIASKMILDKFKNIEVWCWESCTQHKMKLVDLKINEDSLNKEKYKYLKAVLDKRHGSVEEGIFADYGASITSFYPRSIRNYEVVYCDLVIDSERDKSSRLIVSDKNVFNNKKKNTVKLIKNLQQEYVTGLFNEMINN